MASKAIGFLNFKFSADLTAFERAMKKAQKKLKKFGKSITKVGTTLSRNLTLPILGLAAAALKFGSDLEETNAKFLTVFSSMQEEAEETAKVFKDSFGLSELAAKDMLSGTGDLLVGIGLTESGALDLSTKINELAVDLASFTNFSGGAKGASDALTKALLGERESIKSLGISINEADLKEFAANQGLVWKELDKGTRAMLTYELAAQQSFKAIGDFERTSGSFANQMRIVKGDLIDVAAEMGARLIPYAQAAIEKLKGLIVWFEGLSDSTKDNIVKWGLIVAAIGPVLIVIGKMSLGISALIPIFTKLGKFLLASPYLLLAAAVVILIKTTYDWATAVNGVEKAKQQLHDITINAIVQAKEEERLLVKNLEIAKDRTKSDGEREKAIAVLNNKLVSLNGTLNLENIAETNVTNAINKHTEALMNQAKIAGIQDLITEKFRKLTESKLNADIALDDMSALEKTGKGLSIIFQNLISGENLITGSASKEAGKKVINDFGEGKKSEIDFLENELEDLITITPIVEITADLGGVGDLIPPPDADGKKAKQIEGITLAVEDYSDQVMELSTAPSFDDLFPTGPIEEWRGALGILGEEMAMFFGTDIEEMEAGLMTIMENIGGELSQGAESFKEYGQVVKGVIRDVIGGLISQGITAALTNAMSSIPPFPGSVFLIPALAGAAAGLARTAFNSLIPKFAEGGMVTGPTTALVGEGIGTSISNPEVIAPLDKLKSMIGGGNQHITVTGKLIGNDIFLSNAKTGVDRLRTV